MASIPTSAAKREGVTWTSKPVSCWHCGRSNEASLFCPACDAIQPFPDHADYFDVLGLPRSLIIDTEQLQKRYYELHRRLHPDLYQTGAPEARQASLRNTAAVNQAFRTLRDPTDRGIYWLTLQGEALGSNNNRVPPELAELVFEVQEKLEDYRAARKKQPNAALLEEVGQVRGDLKMRHDELSRQLQANFRKWDESAGDPVALTRELKSILSDLAYLGTLIRDVDKELES
jgi:molecular chaperone HscB